MENERIAGYREVLDVARQAGRAHSHEARGHLRSNLRYLSHLPVPDGIGDAEIFRGAVAWRMAREYMRSNHRVEVNAGASDDVAAYLAGMSVSLRGQVEEYAAHVLGAHDDFASLARLFDGTGRRFTGGQLQDYVSSRLRDLAGELRERGVAVRDPRSFVWSLALAALHVYKWRSSRESMDDDERNAILRANGIGALDERLFNEALRFVEEAVPHGDALIPEPPRFEAPSTPRSDDDDVVWLKLRILGEWIPRLVGVSAHDRRRIYDAAIALLDG